MDSNHELDKILKTRNLLILRSHRSHRKQQKQGLGTNLYKNPSRDSNVSARADSEVPLRLVDILIAGA
jgi:hypothetical protein